MPPREEEDVRLERATEYANEAMDKAGIPRDEPADSDAASPETEPQARREQDPSQLIDRLTVPAHQRHKESRRDREYRQRIEDLEKKLSDQIAALAPKPQAEAEPNYLEDPVGWQEWRDKQFLDKVVAGVAERVAPPPQDPQEAQREAYVRQQTEYLDSSMVEYVDSTWSAQGFSSAQQAAESLHARSKWWQEERVKFHMQRGFDQQTAQQQMFGEINGIVRYAADRGLNPVAHLDSVVIGERVRYENALAVQQGHGGLSVDEDREERRAAAQSSMANSLSSSAPAGRSGGGEALPRVKLEGMDHKKYRELVEKNRRPGEGSKQAERRIARELLAGRTRA